MDQLCRTFVSGLVTIIPVAVTAYLVLWAGRSAERFFGNIAKTVLPETWYVPGLGIFMAIVFVLLVGAFLKAWLFEKLLGLGERLLERIPLVQTIYTSLRDLLQFLSGAREESRLRQVALVEIQSGVYAIGFITDERPEIGLPELAGEDTEDRVAVYLPMGYQIGGYTLYLPRSRLRPLDMGIEEAMRMVLTASVNRPARIARKTGAKEGN
jgi:uncharacterized membrane protein